MGKYQEMHRCDSGAYRHWVYICKTHRGKYQWFIYHDGPWANQGEDLDDGLADCVHDCLVAANQAYRDIIDNARVINFAMGRAGVIW